MNRPSRNASKRFWRPWGQILQNGSCRRPRTAFEPVARNPSKLLPARLLNLLFGLGPEMLQNTLPQASWKYFWPWGQKLFKTASWRLAETIFKLEIRNVSKRFPGVLLSLVLGLRPEMLQNCLLQVSCTYFWALGQKCFKTSSCTARGATFRFGIRNASKQIPGGVSEVLFSLRPKIIQNRLLQPFWTYLWAWAQNTSKQLPARFLELFLGLLPEIL